MEVSYSPSRKIFKATVTSAIHSRPGDKPLTYYFLAVSDASIKEHMIKFHNHSGNVIDVREFDEADVIGSISIHAIK